MSLGVPIQFEGDFIVNSTCAVVKNQSRSESQRADGLFFHDNAPAELIVRAPQRAEKLTAVH